MEKCYVASEKGLIETYKKALQKDISSIKSFDNLKNPLKPSFFLSNIIISSICSSSESRSDALELSLTKILNLVLNFLR